MSVSVVISTPIEPVLLSALQTPMTVSRDTQASSQASAGTPGSCMALQEGQATRTVRPLRPEGRAAAWRPGQDVVLSGREASSHYRCPFPRNLVWKKAEGWHLREAVPAPGQAERSWALRHSMAQLVASPSVQGPEACVPGTRLGDPRPTWARCSGRAVVPGTHPGGRASNAPIWPLGHTSIGPYI